MHLGAVSSRHVRTGLARIVGGTLSAIAFFAMFVLLLGYPVAAGPEPSCKAGYKTYTGIEPGGRITFEYPCDWHLESVEVHDQCVLTTFLGPATQDRRDSGLLRVASNLKKAHGGEMQDATAILLALAKGLPAFELIDRSNTYLGGVEAQQVSYYHERSIETYPSVREEEDDYLPTVTWVVLADRGDRIYYLAMRSPASQAEANSAALDHLLETFRFLD